MTKEQADHRIHLESAFLLSPPVLTAFCMPAKQNITAISTTVNDLTRFTDAYGLMDSPLAIFGVQQE